MDQPQSITTRSDPPEGYLDRGDSPGITMDFSAVANDDFDFDAFLRSDGHETGYLSGAELGEMSDDELLEYCRGRPGSELWPVLCACVESGRKPLLRRLLEQGVKPTSDVAEAVAQSGDRGMAGLILQHGWAINQPVDESNTIGSMIW